MYLGGWTGAAQFAGDFRFTKVRCETQWAFKARLPGQVEQELTLRPEADGGEGEHSEAMQGAEA